MTPEIRTAKAKMGSVASSWHRSRIPYLFKDLSKREKILIHRYNSSLTFSSSFRRPDLAVCSRRENIHISRLTSSPDLAVSSRGCASTTSAGPAVFRDPFVSNSPADITSPAYVTSPAYAGIHDQTEKSDGEWRYFSLTYSKEQRQIVLDVLNGIEQEVLAAIPKVGKKRASTIVFHRLSIQQQQQLQEQQQQQQQQQQDPGKQEEHSSSSSVPSSSLHYDPPFYDLYQLVHLKGMGHVNVDVVCEAVLKAFSQKKYSFLKSLTSISPEPTRARSRAADTPSETEPSDKANTRVKKSGGGVGSFCQPQLTARDLENVRSWITMDLFPHQIIWVKFRVLSGVQNPVQSSVDSQDPEEPEEPEEPEVEVEAWKVETFGFSENDINTKYNHAKYLKCARQLLKRLPPADIYFLLDSAESFTRNNSSRFEKHRIQRAFLEGVIVTSLSASSSSVPFPGFEPRHATRVFKLRPATVARHFDIVSIEGDSATGKVASAAAAVDALMADREDVILKASLAEQLLRGNTVARHTYAPAWLAAYFVKDKIKSVFMSPDDEEDDDD